jgi:galactokinase
MRNSPSSLSVISPGRVNLLGEHIDYNGGVVLPAAIDRAIHLEAEPRHDQVVHLEALEYHQQISFNLSEIADKKDITGQALPGWALYPAGVAWVAAQQGYPLSGIHASFSSNIPIGAGLSSSAALEIAFAVLWQRLGGWKINSIALAQLCQTAENQYVGVNCGLMDQFACLHGVDGSALYFDTRALTWQPVLLPPQSVIVIADSGVRRQLTNSAYNNRRAACKEAVRLLEQRLPGIETLRDVSLSDFNRLAYLLPPEVHLRAQHVVEEIDRVAKSHQFLENGDAAGFGQLMLDCHRSLRDLYEVSCPELDTLVEIAASLPGCWGARLTGAGFGGCTVNLVQESAATEFISQLKKLYFERIGKQAEVYLCRASQGAHLMDTN